MRHFVGTGCGPLLPISPRGLSANAEPGRARTASPGSVRPPDPVLVPGLSPDPAAVHLRPVLGKTREPSTTDPPLISVIIPCYNHEKYVEQSLRSVFSQPYKNVELIAIDDGSRDSTPAILRDLGDRYGFTYELHTDNRGICHTLNKALSLSHGPYIKFLASDDYLHDQSLSEFVACMEADPTIDVCFGDLIEVDKNGFWTGRLKSGIQKRFQRTFPVDSVVDISLEMAIQLSPIIGPSYVIKRSVLQAFGPFDEDQIVEDWDLFLHLLSRSRKMAYIPAVAGYYRTFAPEERPYRRDNQKWFFSDLRIVSKYREQASRRSFRIAVKNLVRMHALVSVSCEESPFYLISLTKRFRFLWVLGADFRFLSQIARLVRKNALRKIRARVGLL